MVNIRKPVAKPTSNSDAGDAREIELKQLERRYRSSFRKVSQSDGCTIIRFALQPSDPDFPYELESLLLQLRVPDRYPKEHCTLTVLSSIPKGFAFNIERGYENHTRQTTTTLVRQMNWLDRNLESLLQQEAAATMRFVIPAAAKASSSEPLVAPALPDEFIAAVSSPKQQPQQQKAPAAAATKDTPSMHRPAPPPSPPKLDARAMPFFTSAQLEAAASKRTHELRQLETRFSTSYKTVKSDAVETVVSLTVTLTDPDFAFKDTLGHELKIKYHVPAQYPLLPSTIEVENKVLSADEARDIAYAFADHVEDTQRTLFQNLNWLNRHIERILKNPQERPWQAPQSESSEYTAAAAAPPEPARKPINQVDDTRRVVVVDSAEELLPPGVEWSEIQPRAPEASQASAEVAAAAAAAAAAEQDVQQQQPEETQEQEGESSKQQQDEAPAVRKGTEVRLLEPRFENCTLVRVVGLQVEVMCSRCKVMVMIDNLTPPDILSPAAGDGSGAASKKNERWVNCTTCSSMVGAKFVPELMHENSNVAGLLQVGGCKAYSVLPSLFMGTCAKCMEDFPSPLRVLPKLSNCQSCHARTSIAHGGCELVAVGPREGEGIQPSEDARKTMALKKKKKTDKERLVVGEPLPERGACSHYRKSRRWFRFGCCNKLYACDVCHDASEDHPSELAQRHVCGLCSKEQAVKAVCSGCGHEFDKSHQKGAFWEGGEGVRNRALMSRRDPHKHKGLHKTVSKKQERVGAEGKRRRQPGPE